MMEANQMILEELSLKKSVQKSQEVLNIAKYLYYRGEIFLKLKNYE